MEHDSLWRHWHSEKQTDDVLVFGRSGDCPVGQEPGIYWAPTCVFSPELRCWGKENAGSTAFALQEHTIYLGRLGRFQLSIWKPQRGVHEMPDTLVPTVSSGVIQCGLWRRFLRPWRRTGCWLVNCTLNIVAANGYDFDFGNWWNVLELDSSGLMYNFADLLKTWNCTL